jgi:hypothetical protein
VPLAVPILGACASLGLMLFAARQAFLTGLVILALGGVLVGLRVAARRTARV